MRSTNHTLTRDLVVLMLLTGLSAAPYVFKLGYYGDDWGFLGILFHSPDPSIAGLFAAQYPDHNMRMRPTQMLYQAVLFKAFGLHPLGYHAVNALVLSAAVLLLYAVLREVGMPRLVTQAVSVVYLLLPNYSADRFWFASFGYTLTTALFLLSIYAFLRALRSPQFVLWFSVGLSAETASLLGMEIVVPLAVVMPVALWIQSRRLYSHDVQPHLQVLKTFFLLGGPIVALAAVVWYKAENAVGAASPTISRLILLVIGSLGVNFGTYGLALPHTVAWSIKQLTPAALVLPCILGAVVFLWLRRGQIPPDSRRLWMVLVTGGAFVFCLGIGIFVVTPRVGFWSTGIMNRVWIVAALGVAATLVGAVGWLTSRFSRDLHHRLFAAVIATLCASCFAVNVALSQYWVTAWARQLDILDKLQRTLAHPRSGTTLLLYGACPYVGSAVVFESPWDFAGARKVLYRDPTLAGDVLDDSHPGKFGITQDGIWTRLYRESRTYSFGPDLLLFDYRSGEVRQLVDRASAVAALAHPAGCPAGVEGGGTVSLPFDTWYVVANRRISGLWR